MKILVAEDNFVFANTLELLIEDLDYELVGIANHADELLRMYYASEPDLLLLDIQLNGTKDGIDIATQIMESNKPVPIIFMTAFKDAATFQRAKATNPFAFLVKPFDALLLQRTIELAFYKYEQGVWDEENFIGWEKDILIKDSLFIKTDQRLEKVPIHDIVYIDVLTKYTNIYTTQQVYALRMSMKELYEKLPTGVFIQINRHTLVNAVFIQQIDLQQNKVLLADKELALSRHYRDYVLGRLNII